jgi:hypothetical protein
LTKVVMTECISPMSTGLHHQGHMSVHTLVLIVLTFTCTAFLPGPGPNCDD